MKKKILVIDDEPAIAQLIKINLETEGYDVETALSGTEGIQKVKEFIPDIITLDVLMPEMNGFQVMEVLRADPETRDIPVIFISIVEGVQKEKCFYLGAVDFLSKPIDFGELIKSIQRIETKVTLGPTKQVLVIDDEPDTANLIKEHISSEGYKPIVAYNGPDGVALAKTQKPDLIILDLYMPEMDGFAVMKVLKQDKQTEHIPIVILTGHDTKGYREKCLMLGATEYMTKPFTEEDLITEIRKQIG